MISTDPPPAPRTTRIIAIALALAALLIVALILLVSSGQQEEQIPPSSAANAQPATPSPTVGVTSTTVVAPNAAPVTPSSFQLPTPAISETNVVARVNGQVIVSGAAAVMRLADMAAARLLGQVLPPDESGLLDRLVNGELVAQAAQSAGFQLSATDVDIALQSWLAGLNKTQGELEHELDAVGLDLPGFRAYFAQLLTVDRFATLAAHNAGVDVADYLRTLQSNSQVSLGPAAADLYQATTAVGDVTQESARDAKGDAAEKTTTAQAPATGDAAAPAAQTSPFNWVVIADQPAAMTPLSATAGIETDEVRSPEAGRLAPLFDLALLGDDPTARLTLADLAGKPTVLSFCAGLGQQRCPGIVSGHHHARHGDPGRRQR